MSYLFKVNSSPPVYSLHAAAASLQSLIHSLCFLRHQAENTQTLTDIKKKDVQI